LRGGEALDNLHGSAAKRTLPQRVNGQRRRMTMRWLSMSLSREEVSRLINAAGTLFRRTLLMTLYGTRMRLSELAHLKVKAICTLLTTEPLSKVCPVIVRNR
jgi:integrase